MKVAIEELTKENFHLDSLDDFIRRQEVSECWRLVDGQWKLLPIAFVDDWTLEDARKRAVGIQSHLGKGWLAYGAFLESRLIGFAVVDKEPFGSRKQYVDLWQLHVSKPCRGQGIGKKLFHAACDAAKGLGAEKLYISAHSAKESQAAYRALGCVPAEEINQRLAEKEPCDVQMEYDLSKGESYDL